MKIADCDLITDYLDGELDSEQTKQFLRHVQDCQFCTMEVAQVQELDQRLRRAWLEEITAPAELRKSIENVAVPRQTRRIADLVLRVALAASLLGAVAVGSLLIHQQRHGDAKLPIAGSQFSKPGIDESNSGTTGSPVKVAFHGNTIGIPVDTDDPGITFFLVYDVKPITNATPTDQETRYETTN